MKWHLNPRYAYCQVLDALRHQIATDPEAVSSSFITAHHSHFRWHVKPPLDETNLFPKCSKIASTDETLAGFPSHPYGEAEPPFLAQLVGR